MYRACTFALAAAILVVPYASTEAADDIIPAFDCVKNKEKIVGDATTYNPYAPGWKTGGPGLSTGGTYNPDAWEAAIQTDIGSKYGCGVGAGKTCRAVVSVPSTKRAAIILINDNGPMCADPETYAKSAECKKRGKYTRVIDFNKQSMFFFSNGSSGNNVGTLYDVEVALLDPKCNNIGKLGPLTGADNEAWSKIVDKLPPTQLPMTAPPYGPGMMQPVLSSGYGAYSSQGASSGYGAQPNFGTNTSGLPVPGQPGTGTGSTSPSTQKQLASVGILVQPQTVKKNASVMLSWTSVGMKPFSCKVKRNDDEFAQGNDATRRDVATDIGTIRYSVTCETESGETLSASATLTVN